MVLGGTYVRYKCIKYHLFSDGTNAKTARCDPVTLKWTAVPGNCIRKTLCFYKESTGVGVVALCYQHVLIVPQLSQIQSEQ